MLTCLYTFLTRPMMDHASEKEVPAALRRWFVVHFIADMLFALPLIFAPTAFLSLLGWEVIDPFTARLVGAALVGIGTESLLGRNASAQSFLTMLRLKLLWSSTAALGIFLSMLDGAPILGWGIFGIFVTFNALWAYWYARLKKALK